MSDESAATRARIEAQLEDEHHSALVALIELYRERDRLKEQLAKWQALLHIVPEGAEGPSDVAHCIVRLRAVAEAAKELAKDEQWVRAPVGGWYRNAALAFHSRATLAEALLALGPEEWDWRNK